jgi:hypothetical protein
MVLLRSPLLLLLRVIVDRAGGSTEVVIVGLQGALNLVRGVNDVVEVILLAVLMVVTGAVLLVHWQDHQGRRRSGKGSSPLAAVRRMHPPMFLHGHSFSLQHPCPVR